MKNKTEAIKEFKKKNGPDVVTPGLEGRYYNEAKVEQFISKVWDEAYKKAWDEAKETFDLKEVEL